MKGITPVIAIILLLLMAVAAAGGFYFVYQGFTESGEESGATQIESLGDQTLAQIQIESAAGGRLYVRNTGATDIDLSKSTVYVENQPVEVDRSSDRVGEKERAVLKLTEAPGCTKERCEVKISGTASTTQKVDLSRLICSSDVDCYSGETCEGGVCVEEETGEAVCGDGECTGSEDGMDCYEDCGLETLMMSDSDGNDLEAFVFTWDGSNYQKENFTANSRHEMFYSIEFDSQGNAMSMGVITAMGPAFDDEVSWSFYDGSSWSPIDENVTENDWYDNVFPLFDFNSSDEAIATWKTGGSDGSSENVAWASFDGTWSPVQNITSNEGSDVTVDDPVFAFSPADDSGMLVWSSESSEKLWLNYSVWDGSSWAEEGYIHTLPIPSGRHADWCDMEFNSTHAMAVWVMEWDCPSPNEVLQWATWDGASWSEAENVSDTLSRYNFPRVEVDGNGLWLLTVSKEEIQPRWPEYYTWNGGWVHQGNFTGDPIANSGMVKNHNDAIFASLTTGEGTGFYGFTYWDGSSWAEPILLE